MTISKEDIFLFLLFLGIFLILVSMIGIALSQVSSKDLNVTYGGVVILGPVVIPFGYLSNKKFLVMWIVISIVLLIIFTFQFLRR